MAEDIRKTVQRKLRSTGPVVLSRKEAERVIDEIGRLRERRDSTLSALMSVGTGRTL